MTETRNVFPENMPDIPLGDLPEPLVPGGFWEPEPDRVSERRSEPDYESLVRAAFMAALGVLAAKVAWILLMANFLGLSIGIRLWGTVMPYFAIELTNRDQFATIIVVSTIGMAFVAVLFMVWPLIHPGHSRFQVWGRAVGLVITLETFLLEVFRHLLDPPTVRWDLAWIVPVVIAVGVALLFLRLKQPPRVAEDIGKSAEQSPVAEQVILEDQR